VPRILCFSRNRRTSVEQLDDQTMRSASSLQDNLTEAWVEIVVTLPDLEIIGVKGEVRRALQGQNFDPTQVLQKVVGVRVGPGMLKIIKGLLGDDPHLDQLAFMVEECCYGVILSLTKDVLSECPQDEEKAKQYYTEMVQGNVRLYNRCAAFAPGSSIVEGIDPPT